MKPITQQEIIDYVEANIQVFHQKRLDSLQRLKMLDVVKQKNPYLFKAKNIIVKPTITWTLCGEVTNLASGDGWGCHPPKCSHIFGLYYNTAQDFVKTILDARLSSQEETIFDGFLEGLAIFICSKVYGGQKSSAEGIDLEFEKDGRRYIVSIKSGPNWGNSSQVKKLRDNFRQAKRILGTNRLSTNVVAVNGCCYGKDGTPDKGDYLKLCGQQFWKFISGDDNLYTIRVNLVRNMCIFSV